MRDLDRFEGKCSAVSRAYVARSVWDRMGDDFVQPTVLACTDPMDEVFSTEYFGPILGVHVFDDADYDSVVAQAADISPYALTGSIIAQDRAAIAAATEALRFTAGNFYINDKPTGAVVGRGLLF